MKVSAIIPSRMGSSRLPGKPLKFILALPMIEHVRRRTMLCHLFDSVIVATCDQEILDLVNSYGGKAVMTSHLHQRPSERTEEASRHLDLNEEDIVLMVQGDEPMLLPETLEKVVRPLLEDPELLVTNLVHPIKDKTELLSKDVVKVALSPLDDILFYSRSPIPSGYTTEEFPFHKQSGIIAFRKKILKKYAEIASTPLEINESVDMLRFIEHGIKIKAVISQHETKGVDTPAHLQMVEKLLTEDSEQNKLYKKIISSEE